MFMHIWEGGKLAIFLSKLPPRSPHTYLQPKEERQAAGMARGHGGVCAREGCLLVPSPSTPSHTHAHTHEPVDSLS